MQNPKEDTQWNDILRSKGILPPKEVEITENDVISFIEQALEEHQGKGKKKLDDLNLEELDELEDEEDEEVLLKYRKRRMAELRALANREKFGSVIEITAKDYIQQVNNAGDGIWVVVLLYKPGHPLCTLINEYITKLAAKFRETKFIRSISSLCVPNYPDRNLPTIFVYYEGEVKQQIVVPMELRGLNTTCDELEWTLGVSGAVKTLIEEDPRPKVENVLFKNLSRRWNEDDDDDFQ